MEDSIRVLLVDQESRVTPLVDGPELSAFEWTVCNSLDALPDSSGRLQFEVGVRVLAEDEVDAFEDWLTNARARRSARAVFMPFLFTYILVNFVFSRK